MGETADILTQHVTKNGFKKSDLEHKTGPYCTNDTNSARVRFQANINVHTKVQHMGRKLLDIRCCAYIIHNYLESEWH